MRRSRPVGLTMPALVVTTVACVLAAAVGGPWRLTYRFGIFGPAQPSDNSVTPPPMPSFQPQPPTPEAQPARWLAVVGWILLVLLVALVGWRIWRWFMQRTWAGSGAVGTALPAASVVGLPDLPVIHHGVDVALATLAATTDPTDAVIRAWLELEDAAARSGAPRNPADTPTEFTGQVLSATSVDQASIEELLELYERARFSRTGLTAEARGQARDCLERLSASWSVFDATSPDENGSAGPA